MTEQQWTALIDRDERYRSVYEKTHGREWSRAEMPSDYKPGEVPDIRPCVHIGARLEGEPCGSPLMRCNLYRDITTRFYVCEKANRCCNGCPDKVTSGDRGK